MGRKNYTCIAVPRPLKERVKMLAEKKHTTQVNVVEEAIGHLEILYRRPYTKSELPLLDKVSWYIYKLASSIGAFKENNSKENYLRLLSTIEQIEDRLIIDLSFLKYTIQKYDPTRKKKLTTRDKIDINDTAKNAIARLITHMLQMEERLYGDSYDLNSHEDVQE